MSFSNKGLSKNVIESLSLTVPVWYLVDLVIGDLEPTTISRGSEFGTVVLACHDGRVPIASRAIRVNKS